MSPPPSDVPKEYRPIWSFLLLAAAILTFGGVTLFGIRAEAQSAAREVVTSEFGAQLRKEAVEAAKQAASEAARQAVLDVMRDTIIPLRVDVERHNAEDNQRVKEMQRRLDSLEGRK